MFGIKSIYDIKFTFYITLLAPCQLTNNFISPKTKNRGLFSINQQLL